MTPAELARSGTPPLIDVLERLARAPHFEVVRDRPLVPIHDVASVDNDAIEAALVDFGAVELAPDDPVHAWVGGIPLRFERLHDTRSRTTVDTPPNRFLARFVVRLRGALGEPSELTARLDRISGSLGPVSLTRRPSVDDPVLRHDPLYRRVVLASMELDRGGSGRRR